MLDQPVNHKKTYSYHVPLESPQTEMGLTCKGNKLSKSMYLFNFPFICS